METSQHTQHHPPGPGLRDPGRHSAVSVTAGDGGQEVETSTDQTEAGRQTTPV